MDSGVLERVGGVQSDHKGWIQSPAFDLTFFALSPLIGLVLAVIGLQYAGSVPAILVAATYWIGVPHYLASFAFYMGDENRSYAREFWLLFYAGPILICVAVAVLYLGGAGNIVHAVLFVWNIYHVATQSSGILSLYRRLAGGSDSERVRAHRTIVFANAAMAFWFLDRFPPLWNLLVGVHPELPQLLKWSCLVAALSYGVAYARALRIRAAQMSPAEATFLTSSLLLFTPYLWLDDSQFATLAMLVGHFIQYLAIVWLLNRRKYGSLKGSRTQRWLGRFGESWRVVAIFMLVAGILFLLLDRGSQAFRLYTGFMILFNSLALAHFWLDGLIWAFKNPYIRRTVGPYLTLEANRLP